MHIYLSTLHFQLKYSDANKQRTNYYLLLYISKLDSYNFFIFRRNQDLVYPLSCRNIIFQQSVFFSYLNAPLGNPNHVCPSPLTQVSPKGRCDIFQHQLYGCRKVERNVSSERLKHNPSVIKGV